MGREEAKVGNLEMRAKVREDVWVRRLTAGRDIVKGELGIGSKSRIQQLTQLESGRRGDGSLFKNKWTKGEMLGKGENVRGRVPS
jgi:hypothetical protein